MARDWVTFGELPKLLGVSRTTAWRYAQKKGFPKPLQRADVATLGLGRVWLAEEVKAWKRKTLKTPLVRGRPPKP